MSFNRPTAAPPRHLLGRFQCVGSALQHLIEARSKLASTEVGSDAELSQQIETIADAVQETRDALLREMDDLAKLTKLLPEERARLALAGLPKANRLRFCASQIRECCPDGEADDSARFLDALASTVAYEDALGSKPSGGEHV